MKIFLSWSGEASRRFAEVFKDLIEQVCPWSDVYISDQDIESGERWLYNVAGTLEQSNFGIIFLTNSNKSAPWILFEAGALSKSLSDSRLVPVLCDISDIDLTGNPLSQFQYRKLTHDDVLKVVRDVNKRSDKPALWDRLVKTFEAFWPEYQEKFDTLKSEFPRPATEKNPKSGTVDMVQLQNSIDEVLRAVRGRSLRPRDRMDDDLSIVERRPIIRFNKIVDGSLYKTVVNDGVAKITNTSTDKMITVILSATDPAGWHREIDDFIRSLPDDMR